MWDVPLSQQEEGVCQWDSLDPCMDATGSILGSLDPCVLSFNDTDSGLTGVAHLGELSLQTAGKPSPGGIPSTPKG